VSVFLTDWLIGLVDLYCDGVRDDDKQQQARADEVLVVLRMDLDGGTGRVGIGNYSQVPVAQRIAVLLFGVPGTQGHLQAVRFIIIVAVIFVASQPGPPGVCRLGLFCFADRIAAQFLFSFCFSLFPCFALVHKHTRRYASLFFILGTRPDADDDNDGPAENTENELGMLEFIHTLVETMDKWAGSICELDIMYQLEEVHFLGTYCVPIVTDEGISFSRFSMKTRGCRRSFLCLSRFASSPAIDIKNTTSIVDEMVQNGFIVETNKTNILRPIALMERESAKAESMFR